MKLIALIFALILSNFCCAQITCNNWLSLPTGPSFARIGDLDITGDQITVEAVFYRTSFLSNGVYSGGDLVSKHNTPSDINYLLRPDNASITTTNGFYETPPTCDLELNKIYHVAMVYDGSILKFYRNGYLLSQVAATGELVQNDWLTQIGEYFPQFWDENFIGYINEVRIWNVARTKAQINTYMNTSLPSPTTQTGLLAYYTFDNLLNKQGNVAWNLSLIGGASINSNVPTCNFIADSCAVPATSSCNNWLSTPSLPSYAEVGEIDIPGQAITVEAVFNRTTPYSGGLLYAGDLVSKHNTPADANYLLRPNDAEITTSNGYFRTPDICEIELNKTYHVALVYDGSTLKFYRNGFLMSQIPATGNLFQNNWKTRIGYYEPGAVNTNFIGYINEVRIWNVARTQAQIKANMNTALPNPTTQPGLLGYYTFDNLINKQGNAAFNGSLGGSASITSNNPNCTLSVDSCPVITGTCSNWLSTPSVSSAVKIGDLDIPGNEVTVEAMINRTTPYLPGGGDNTEGDIVSKHNDFTDVNYLLRPNHAYITTTNGFFATPDICDLELNKNYHVAMVYDGNFLKFYRDGFLMSQVAATGNLILNNWNTKIGHYDPQFWKTQFVGYTNEVRIWNTARTQAQLKAFMNTSLPNPSTQPGLLAYYSFDNLQNKQGNTTFNAVLDGNASINAPNPICSFILDSCPVIPVPNGNSIIINEYTPVIAFNPCNNSITVEDATKYNSGDTVVIMQMKGAIIDSSNTTAFGTITDYKNAGNYEFNYVKSKAGNVIELKNVLTRQYDLPDGKVQLIRVPYFQNYLVKDTLTCLPWDGKKGGVLVLNVKDTVDMQADINVSGRGFQGGIDPFSNPPIHNCYENEFYYPPNPDLASEKGEGISSLSSEKSFGKGAPANGGGGGNSHNSGGGGGANAGNGGLGGYQFEGYPCNTTVPFDNRGIGGNSLIYNNASNKIFLGGGGGAGHSNNPEAFEARGGNGAGIVIINSTYLISHGNKISSNGYEGKPCGDVSSGCHEGMGGGGAGGSILLNINSYLDNIITEANGGKGGDMTAVGFERVAPGGGGGGGNIWLRQNSLPMNMTVSFNGGVNGICPGYNNTNWGAQPGLAGKNLFNLVLPISVSPFKHNIDSVRIKTSSLGCNSFNLNGLAYINKATINNWKWTFDDGTTATIQNTTHSYAVLGSHLVKLVVMDNNGCKDSVTITLTTVAAPAIPGTTLVAATCTTPTGAINITSPLGVNYQYSIDGINYQTSSSFTNLPIGSYSLTVKDINTGCISAGSSVTISPSPVPSDPTSTIIQPTCTTSTGSINVSGPLGTNFEYSIDNLNYQTGINFTNLTSGNYNLTVRNIATKCVSNKVPITINPPLIVPSTPISNVGQPVCSNQNGSISVVSPTGANIEYSINNSTYQSSVNFTNLSPGTYSLTAKNNSSGCISAAATVVINSGTGSPAAPLASVTSQPNCINTTGSITVSQPVGTTYQYSIDGTSFQTSAIFTNIASGNYNLSVKNTSNGCLSTLTPVTVNALPQPPSAPLFNIVQPTCAVKTGTVNITVQGGNLLYSINNGLFQSVTSFSTLAPGSYSIVAMDPATQCKSTATIATVDPVPLPPAAPVIGSVTQPNCTIPTGTVTINEPLGADFEYSINGSVYQSANLFNNLANGSYNLTVKNTKTVCVSPSTLATINLPPPLPPSPVARVSVQPTCIISSGTIVISNPLGNNFEYSVDGVNFQSSTSFTGLTPNTYNVSVKDISIECISRPVAVTVSVNTGTAGTYKIPNAFTPNNDGFNECFGIKYWGVIADFKLIIYNRWGQMVFSTTNANDCWDGKFKGVAASQGNYVYYIKATTLCGPVEKKGNVLLIR